MDKLKLTSKKNTKKDVAAIHAALNTLNFKLEKKELTSREIGKSTIDAIKTFQKKHKLRSTGTLTNPTVNAMNKVLVDAHYSNSKTRTAKLHNLLERLEIPLSIEEKKKRITGTETRKAIKKLQKDLGFTVNGKITEEFVSTVQEKVIEKQFSTKTQIGKLQGTLKRALQIAKLPVEISEDELKDKKLGETSAKAIKELQSKYNIAATGELNKTTLDKIQSIAASKGTPIKWKKKSAAQDLKLIKSSLSVNKTSPKVNELQNALSYLGYKIDSKEYNTQTFGKSTFNSIINYQTKNSLPQTGKLDKATLKKINTSIKSINPLAKPVYNIYKIKGSVRDMLNERKGNMVLHIYEKLIDGESQEPLMTKKNHSNGFFDIVYNPPLDKANNKPKEKFHLVVKLLDENDQLITSKIIYNAGKTQWINFNLSGEKYQGDSKFHVIKKALEPILKNTDILELKETDTDKPITQLSKQTGLTIDDLMNFILAHHVANDSSFASALSAEVFYAFIAQNLPDALPGDLLRATNDWETTPQLIELTKSGIVFLDQELILETLDSAIKQNLVSLVVKQEKEAVAEKISKLRESYVLEKPILIGNANLKALLEESAVPESKYAGVANIFLNSNGANTSFWETIKTEAIINDEEIKDLKTIMTLGNITKNHMPIVQILKQDIGDDPNKKFKRASDIAKLSTEDFISVIGNNESFIPENIPGDSFEERAITYANALQSRAEFTFPIVAMVAAVKKGNAHTLQKINEVENFIDTHSEVDFATENMDKYLMDNSIQLDESIKEEVKVFQRIHKLTPVAAAGKVLIEEGLHSSNRIFALSKQRLTTLFEAKGVEAKYAVKLHEMAKSKYAQILGRLMDFSPHIHWGNPQAIISQTYKSAEVKEALGDIPNLEKLFGSLDFCECKHCKSLYGPAAYFTDLIRFLKQHDSLILQGGTPLSVKEVLFDRRPDLGNIKLNCENTNTPMPYIDLVCELLESHITPKQEDFEHQTTLSADELRAIPQYIRPHAYATLAKANYPMNTSFNLWQEETRSYLNYLRVPRYELMEAFQDTSNALNKKPSDLAIAAEFFAISSHEIKIITAQDEDTLITQNKYWNFNTSQSSIPVSAFLNRTQLTYEELLELLMVRFVNNSDLPSKSVIERPSDTCNVNVQVITNMEIAKFDLMHRFLRLWRRTGWKMWELDLLLRSNGVGKSTIDHQTVVELYKFKKMQSKLQIPFEVLLAFYGDINTEERISPLHEDIKIPSLYDQLFRNITITNPIDEHFEILPLNDSILLEMNTVAPFENYTPLPTIISALAITQSELELLKAKTNGKLSVESLSLLLRYAYLAKGLKISVSNLLLLLDLIGISNPFESIEKTQEVITATTIIIDSGFSIDELHFILTFNVDSPYGLRIEVITQFITALRATLVKSKETIDALKLTEVHLLSIQAIDTGGLALVSDAQLMLDIQPLKDTLKELRETFTEASFSVQELEYILQFDVAISTDKDQLISSIKLLQENVANLIVQNENQTRSHIASTFNFSDQHANLLLKHLILPGQAKTLLELLMNKTLIEKSEEGLYAEINETNFPLHFNTYALLHKVSLLFQKIKLSNEDLEWFLTNHTDIKTLDFSALPIAATATNLYTNWEKLYQLVAFKSKYPEPEGTSFLNVLEMALDPAVAIDDVLLELSNYTQWDSDELKNLHLKLNLKHEVGKLSYTDYKTYLRLQKCMLQSKLTGVDVNNMFLWADRDDDDMQPSIALQSRLAVKSKYEKEEWLQKITPIMDSLRDKKRAALVAYHMEHSQRNQSPEINFNGEDIPNPLFWKDTNALYKYLLIDVEMSSCQLTSRIKQAISSIQLFVQRCFLNLENRYVQVSQEEKEDVTSENAWSQWKWMKVYRIWEANRKVFFYPENWILPELRDDKSPFFEELENDLLQNEITHENVEKSYVNYLHKLDNVANLEVCGTYHEREELNTSELGYEVDIIHVVGRTKAVPHLYYYRKYDLNYSTWTAWEKIEVDIEGDQLVPVVYNRKLHLFWLFFIEKSQKIRKVPPAEMTETPQDAQEPPKMMEIQLAWSVKQEKGWEPKKISKSKLIHPWERPRYAYNLKPYYKSVTNELWLDIYLSTTEEFNNRTFYDPFKHRKVRATRNYFNETYRPWHSSSFIFNGSNVIEINLRGLRSYYNLEALGIKIEIPTATTSYDYVNNNFGEDGAKIKQLSSTEDGPRLRLPAGMHFHNTHLTNNRVHQKNDATLRMPTSNGSLVLLNGAQNPFELVITQQDIQLGVEHPSFYQDHQRAFFIKPEWKERLDQYGQLISRRKKHRFLPFYHPYSTLFIRELNRDGIDGLLNRKIQIKPHNFIPKNNFSFSPIYKPNNAIVTVDAEAQKERLDFSFGGAYAIYNWELFFHAPLMIATRLSQNQRFEEAMRWFHYIFDPTNIENLPTPQRYWVTKPFYENNSVDYRKQRIKNILSNINTEENDYQLKAWRNNPFMPHLIARYRPVAYQRNVVMKYLDNLIAWGDQLFRRDSIESINEASLLYMLAHEILGDRPQKVPNVSTEDLSFNEIEAELDNFGNASVDVILEDTLLPIDVVPSSNGSEALPNIETFYFCIPNNTELLKYWDTVEDRLFKIRNCMNIEGVVRQLPLFQPPIDPALLVKAAAAGIDLSSVLNDLSAGTPHYRFRVTVSKAIEFASEVKQLGDKLLRVLETKDVEALSLLRSNHEIQLLNSIKEVKKKQIDEAVSNIGSLNKSKEFSLQKQSYYEGVPRMNAWEIAGTISHGFGIAFELAGTIVNIFAGGISMVPNLSGGVNGAGGTPEGTLQFGGENMGNAASKAADFLKGMSAISHAAGSMMDTQGSHTRRDEENKQQAKLAEIETKQIDFQISAAKIRQAIAEKDLENHELQIQNTITEGDYLKNKYTNEQLYSWMISQISSIYFQAYQLAYDMAKKAEKNYQYELSIKDSSYIQFGYWDSLKKGLLSGDKLTHDLRRLEAAYMDQNKRGLEITKHISLAQIAPQSLVTLKKTGLCTLSLPEWIFNMDNPGHYLRCIKSVSVSIPCIAGPYTSVNCSLSLIKSEKRLDATLSGGNYAKVDENDIRFETRLGIISSISTSHGQADSGLFELNFNDERYLPFEGAGVISEWQINMPIENNHFDFSSISDIIIHMNYTARDGGNMLAAAANAELQNLLPQNSLKLYSLKHEFPNEWHQFLHPNGGEDQEFAINLTAEQYPFFLRKFTDTLKIKKIEMFMESSEAGDFDLMLKATSTDYENTTTVFSPNPAINNVHYTSREYGGGLKPNALGEFRFKMKLSDGPGTFTSLNENAIDDIFLLCHLDK